MKSFEHIRISISATSSICCASQLAMHQVHAVHHVNFTINHAFHRTASRIAVCKLDSCVWLLCSAERPNQVQSISCQHCTSSLHCRVQKQCKGCKIGGGIELAELVHVALNTNTNTWKSANSCPLHNQLQTQECQQISTITQTNIPEKMAFHCFFLFFMRTYELLSEIIFRTFIHGRFHLVLQLKINNKTSTIDFIQSLHCQNVTYILFTQKNICKLKLDWKPNIWIFKMKKGCFFLKLKLKVQKRASYVIIPVNHEKVLRFEKIRKACNLKAEREFQMQKYKKSGCNFSKQEI